MPSIPSASGYRGRFAPSPTGKLHIGSLLAAVGSWVRARQADGRWLVRMEDIDPPREVPGAADAILRQLDAAGLHWDEAVLYQSTRLDAYRQAADRLLEQRVAYRCTCSRREIALDPRSGPSGTRYPGTCRGGPAHPDRPSAVRVLAPAAPVTFNDVWHGRCTYDVAATTGDYVIHRRDGLPAYHLAVVCDDAWQGITEVVRGSDLLEATASHRHLQALLGTPPPAVAHLPVLIDSAGAKLSKQTGATPLLPAAMAGAVRYCLHALMGPVPRELQGAPPAELLAWARAQPTLAVAAGHHELVSDYPAEVSPETKIE